MRSYKKVQVPASEKDVIDTISCDICGRKVEPREDGQAYWEENPDYSQRTSVKTEVIIGYDVFSTTEIDICGECFRRTLIPWIEKFGKAKIKDNLPEDYEFVETNYIRRKMP
jgi:hypothetical protein